MSFEAWAVIGMIVLGVVYYLVLDHIVAKRRQRRNPLDPEGPARDRSGRR